MWLNSNPALTSFLALFICISLCIQKDKLKVKVIKGRKNRRKKGMWRRKEEHTLWEVCLSLFNLLKNLELIYSFHFILLFLCVFFAMHKNEYIIGALVRVHWSAFRNKTINKNSWNLLRNEPNIKKNKEQNILFLILTEKK